jgi:hypothetical protein
MGLLALLAACTAAQLGPGVNASPAPDGSLTLTAFARNLGATCVAHQRLVLSLRVRGRLILVHGSPATIPLTGRLAANAFRKATYTWRNWCGARQAGVRVVVVGFVGTSLDIKAPACVDRSGPSTLTRRN